MDPAYWLVAGQDGRSLRAGAQAGVGKQLRIVRRGKYRAGAAASAPSAGFMLLTARCSYELVEKTVRAGCPMLVTISAPTSLAIERAASAGLTLVSLARADSALIVCDASGNIA